MKRIVAIFASPAGEEGKVLGQEMAARVREASMNLPTDSVILVASTASGYLPNELYSSLVVDELVRLGVSRDRIKTSGPSASTVSEIDGMEAYIKRAIPFSVEVVVAVSRYQMFRTRFIWKLRHGRKTTPLVLNTRGVSKTYLLLRTIMEPVKFVLYFVLPTKMQDESNHRILGPRGL